jgi:hypothetical protein
MDLFDLEQAMILGGNKDTPHDFKELTFVRNQPLIDAVYRKWEFVGDCLEGGTLPSEDDVVEFALPEIKEVENAN